MSVFNSYHGDTDYIIRWDYIVLDKDLQYVEEPIAIVDHHVRKLGARRLSP